MHRICVVKFDMDAGQPTVTENRVLNHLGGHHEVHCPIPICTCKSQNNSLQYNTCNRNTLLFIN